MISHGDLLRAGVLAALMSPGWAPARAADVPDASRDLAERELRQAQEQLERSARQVAELTMRLDSQARDELRVMSGTAQQRVMLGMNIGGASSEVDAPPVARGNGVRVISVSPGGPADAAGLRAGDVIVGFGGANLEGTPDAAARRQLLGLIHSTQAGVPVDVRYLREGRSQTTRVVPKSVAAFLDDGYLDGLRGLGEGLNSMATSLGTRRGSGFGSAELMELTPGLGGYFGIDHGLLVLRAPHDERLKLEDGDVVLDIDGRVPSSPSHALRILSSYGSGETMKLHLMRHQKRIELSVEMPADTARGWPEPRPLAPGAAPLPAAPSSPAPAPRARPASPSAGPADTFEG